MKEFPVSTRYTAAELKQLDRTARSLKISRAEFIHARSLGKVVATHELADWAEAELAKHAERKGRMAPVLLHASFLIELGKEVAAGQPGPVPAWLRASRSLPDRHSTT